MSYITTVEKNISDSISSCSSSNYILAIEQIEKAINEAVKNNDKNIVAISLALKSLYLYRENKIPFGKIMQELENAHFLADTINNQTAKDTVNFVFTEILLKENDKETAARYFNSIKQKENPYFNYADFKKEFQVKADLKQASNPISALLNIAKTISSKTNIDSLLNTIADETIKSLSAERCSVFLLDKQTNELWSKVATGIDFEEIRFPANKGLAGHVAMTGETVNIKDAYSDNRFNKEIDKQTGYHTRNILCMPMRNMHYEIIGVIQVLNKTDGYFSEYDEKSLVAIGLNAGIAIENSRLFEKQAQMLKEQKQLLASFIDTLVASIDARDKITSGHSNRVKLYAKLICEKMNIEKSLSDLIEQAAILHDIGKIGIKDSVLQKEGKLTPDEYSHIQEHARITYEILSKIYNTKNTEQIALIAASHHDKYDGTGYYKKLKGEEIPLGGRIIAVADVFDAITSKRHYRDKMPIKDVIKILIDDSGSHFDPNVTDNFLKISCDKIVEVFLSEKKQSLSENDKNILSNFNLYEFYDILNTEENLLTDKQKQFINTFELQYNK